MDHSRLGRRLTSKLTDHGKPSSSPSISNSSPDTYYNTTELKPIHRQLPHKHTFRALRSKPSLALRLAQSKQTLCRKASALFRRGQRHGRAVHRNAPKSSIPEATVVQRCFSLTADVEAEESAVADHAGDEMGQRNRPEDIDSAYPCTSAKPTSTLPSAGKCAREAPMTAPSVSPAGSWAMTPASKIAVRESVLRRRASFRTLTYDPSIPLVYLDEGRKGVVDGVPQELQTAGPLLSGAQPGSSHGVSSCENGDQRLEAHAKAAVASDATSSAISPSPLDSDAFDFALARQGQASNDSTTYARPHSNASSRTTLLIHSDAIFLPSAMEAKTSSALPSSESTGRGSGKGSGMGSTASQIAEILRAVQIERDGLVERNRGLWEALRRAEGEVDKLRAEIAGMERGG